VLLLNWKTEMLTLDQLTDIIARGEQLDVEFKSDRRRMNDSEINETLALTGKLAERI
jgi:hypothetical protein